MADALSDGQLREVARYVAEDLRGEFRALLHATAQAPAIPPPNKPPVDFDGLDAKVIERLEFKLLREVREIVERETGDFVPKAEIQRAISDSVGDVARQIADLRTDILKQVENTITASIEKLEKRWFTIFDDLDMPLEEGEHRKATRAKMSGLFAMHAGSKEFRSELWKGIRSAIIGQITLLLLGFLALLGYKGGQH